MRKNTLKKVFASLTLSAVAAVSVSAVTASAAEWGSAVTDKNFGVSADEIAAVEPKITLTIDTKQIKASDQDQEVTLNFSSDSGSWFGLGIHIVYDNALTLSKSTWGQGILNTDLDVAKSKSEFDFTKLPVGKKGILYAASASADFGADGTGVIGSLTFTVPANTEPGFYPVNFYIHNDEDEFQNDAGNTSGSKALQAWTFNNGLVDGGIEIVAPETTTTPAETTTTAPETTTTTAAPVVTTTKGATTTKAATTTKKAATTTAAKKDSPKTGVAGVGVAAAGLVAAASAAFVLRKKED